MLKRMLQSLALLYANMDQYSFLGGESRAKSTLPHESNRSVNLKQTVKDQELVSVCLCVYVCFLLADVWCWLHTNQRRDMMFFNCLRQSC